MAIVIPAYKGRFLKETLDSIAVQAHKDEFVLYIGDDASPERLDIINPQDIDSLDTSFRTLIYDLYSRDLSCKVKSAKKARAERGAFLSPYAPYGYIKDPEDKTICLWMRKPLS